MIFRFPHVCISCLLATLLCSIVMDSVQALGVDLNAPASESAATLTTLSLSQLLTIRSDLFSEAANLGLTSEGDELVSRRDTRKNPLNKKFADDVIALMFCLKNESAVPRSLLKNGKRSKSYLEASRYANTTSTTEPSTSGGTTDNVPGGTTDNIPGGSTDNVFLQANSTSSSNPMGESFRASLIMKDINHLKDEIKDLKKDIAILHRQSSQTPTVPSTCHIRILFPTSNSCVIIESDLGSVGNLLGCPVLSVTKIRSNILKVKIPKECLHTAILSSRSDSHSVNIWRNNPKKPTQMPQASVLHSKTQLTSKLSICTWNCRGLHNSIPYIKVLISKEVDVIILQEHWLWPFQLDQLNSIDNRYTFTAVCDQRLNPSSDFHRGCGGVALLWRKSLNAAAVFHQYSDRICSIQVPLQNSPPLTIHGVYMPSADQPQETYTSYLDTVSQIVSQSDSDAPMIIAGDLNCHLGSLGCPRSNDTPNSRGHKWKDVIDHHTLYVASLSHISSGPIHTYHSGSVSTTVDYVLGNLALSSVLSSCDTLEDHSLNTSDHLPIISNLDMTFLSHSPLESSPFLNWKRSVKEGTISAYTSLTDDLVRPFMEKDYSCIEELDSDVALVSQSLVSTASSTIHTPTGRNRTQNKNSRIFDPFLSTLCWRSRVAYREWKAAGCPRSGDKFENRKKTKRDVASFLSKSRARLERQNIQKRDELFATSDPRRFKYHTQRTEGTSLLIDGTLETNPTTVLNNWASYFANLSESQIPSASQPLPDTWSINQLDASTYSEYDNILNSPFVVEEIEAAIHHLNKDSAGGHDNLSPSHLLYSGPIFKNWICKIFNDILALEDIPSSFKHGLICPVYKGKGKDPLIQHSYRGITLTSVLAKTFEFVLLDRLLPIISDALIPQLTQTAYQKGVSCSEAIFACQEAIAKFTSEGDHIYSCFYDLASAFDTVEYPVLLSHLKRAGVTGKSWRLIKQWYKDPHSSVHLKGLSSSPFPIHRGVRQGSVLSPVLFLLVMDPILVELREKSCGLSINGLFIGALSHADDIRSLSTNLSDCKLQISAVSSFAKSRNLTLSTEKCEAVISPSVPANKSCIEVDGIEIPIVQSARCLGAWWSSSPSSANWIEQNIKKARGAFFARGSGVFHGLLNPLSSRSIVESCVLPVLLYGAESWALNLSLLKKLDSFQAETGRRILCLRKTTATNIVRLALQWPSIRARILCIKLAFLLKILLKEESLSSRVFRSLAVNDVESLVLVKQCRFLESAYGTNLTSTVLSSPEEISLSQLKNDIISMDHSLLLSECDSHPSQHWVLNIATSTNSSWPKVWDHALERGHFGTLCSQALLRLLSLHVHSDNKCPVDECSHYVESESVVDHFLSEHTSLDISAEHCMEALKTCSEDLYNYGKLLNQIFRVIWNNN